MIRIILQYPILHVFSRCFCWVLKIEKNQQVTEMKRSVRFNHFGIGIRALQCRHSIFPILFDMLTLSVIREV